MKNTSKERVDDEGQHCKGLLMALCAALALSGMGALASADDYFCTSFDNCVEGNDYVFLLLKPGTNPGLITEDSLLFIDQYTADSSGRFEVAVLYPDFTACDAVVSGEFSNGEASPRRLGSYIASRLPSALVEIGEEAFMGSTFTHVYLGEHVSTIGSRAFANCADLAYIYIPFSVAQIASDAFSGSPKVVIGCQPGSDAEDFARTRGFDYVTLR